MEEPPCCILTGTPIGIGLEPAFMTNLRKGRIHIGAVASLLELLPEFRSDVAWEEFDSWASRSSKRKRVP